MSTSYSTKRRVGNLVRFGLLGLALVVFLFPFYWLFKTSFEPNNVIYGAVTVVPPEFTLDHYRQAVEIGFLQQVGNSLVVGLGTMVLTTVLSLFAAYSILRYVYPGRQGAARLVLLTYMFPHVALIVPVHQLAANTGLLGHPLGLVLVHTMLALPFCVWILQSFLKDIPRELEEAALVEGASQIEAFIRITIPQAMPGVIAAGTFAFIMSWGEFMFAFVLTTSSANYTVPVEMSNLLGSYAIEWGLIAAVSVIATIPVLAVFWLMAKYLGEGIARGTGVL